MKDEEHDAIKAQLRRMGVTEEAHHSAAIDAHEAGVDVQQIMTDVQAGVPEWLAVVSAIHEKLHGRTPTRGTRAKAKKEEAK